MNFEATMRSQYPRVVTLAFVRCNPLRTGITGPRYVIITVVTNFMRRIEILYLV